MFSDRTAWPLAPNRLHQLATLRRREGTLRDLTVSNPTACGFDYPRVEVLSALGQAASLRYEPQALGLESARAAVAAYYGERGRPVAPDRLVLTASTSEAYAHLFRLLCDPGDEVLMPSPTYPLFEMLAGLNDVRLISCPMVYDRGWQLDLDALEAAATARTRAILLVHPNNPTGSYIKPAEWLRLQGLAQRRGWAVILDEVFRDYPIPPFAAVELEMDPAPALTFVLNGLSKLAALPQMKLAWIAVRGPEASCAAALGRLEAINDLFLSAATPVQHTAAGFLALRHGMQVQIRQRLQANLAVLDAQLTACPAVERLAVEGGWSVVLRLPAIHGDEDWAELLVERAGLLLHPGHFYGFTAEAHLVASLLLPPAAFAGGMAALVDAATIELCK